MIYFESLLLCLTSLLIIGSAIGFWRLKSSMNRLHATGKIGSLVILLILSIHFMQHASVYMGIKSILLILLVYFTSAHASHILSQSLLKSGEAVPSPSKISKAKKEVNSSEEHQPVILS